MERESPTSEAPAPLPSERHGDRPGERSGDRSGDRSRDRSSDRFSDGPGTRSSAEPAKRPTGRDEVRSAVLRAARRLFSERGPRVPLREIADAAGVNLGLIHRHIGRKDALLTAVMQDAVRLGAARLEHTDDAGAAVRGMLLGASSHPEISRLLAWLAVDSEAAFPPMVDPSQRPAAALRRMESPPPAGEVELLLAFTAVYAWPVLRETLLDALDIPADRRAGIDEQLADLLGRVVTGAGGSAADG